MQPKPEIWQEKLKLLGEGEHEAETGCYNFHPPYSGHSEEARISIFGEFSTARALHISGKGYSQLCEKFLPEQQRVWRSCLLEPLDSVRAEEFNFTLERRKSGKGIIDTLTDPTGRKYRILEIVDVGSVGY